MIEENIKEEPLEVEATYTEDTTENNNSKEEAVQSKLSQTTVKNKFFNPSKSSISFRIKLIVAFIFSILALKFIFPPSGSDVFYKLYFVLFTIFEAGVILCYILTNRSKIGRAHV